ncbi:putative ATP-dependent RNA helicase DHR1, partial [Cladochytrium tenue]
MGPPQRLQKRGKRLAAAAAARRKRQRARNAVATPPPPPPGDHADTVTAAVRDIDGDGDGDSVATSDSEPTRVGNDELVPEGGDAEYTATDTAVPLMIIPGESEASTSILDRLPQPPEGRLTSKKRKRLEKFIEKQLKKEQRADLVAKLSQNQFSSDLFRSSKTLGRSEVSGELHESDAEANGKNEPVGPSLIPTATISQPVEAPSVAPGSAKYEDAVSQPTVPTAAPIPLSTEEPAVFGGALKRKLGDSTVGTVSPSIAKRKKKQKVKQVKPMPQALSDDDSNASMESDVQTHPVIEDIKKGAIENPGEVESFSASDEEKDTKLGRKGKRPTWTTDVVTVSRSAAIEQSRSKLPVVGEEQPIMEAILAHDVVLLCGETGSGKTTQVPQFLYEAGFGDPNHPRFPGAVGVTQPRRVAAVSMARRVAEELGFPGSVGETASTGPVAYQIRYDATTVTNKTRIKFMTDGILLKELSAASALDTGKAGEDLLLSKYSCIIIDEAHERTVGTDVLIGWLTRIVKLRNSGRIKGIGPLKLVIMSATLRVEDFTLNKTLFPDGPPPVVKVDGRQYKVTIHYNRVTPETDYIGEAFKKVSKIHTRLPPGAILVFLTGQAEISALVRKLRRAHGTHHKPAAKPPGGAGGRNRDGEAPAFSPAQGQGADAGDVFAEVEDAAGEEGELPVEDGKDDFDLMEQWDEDDEEDDVQVLEGLDGEDDDEADEKSKSESSQAKKEKTSLTIPGVKYVVDCGKVKERRYDPETGVQHFQIGWTSRASADQRAGRAGRVGPGHCYRLFSSAVFGNHFSAFSEPEILRVPVEGVVLQMKAMSIANVVNFPFPTPPGRDVLRAAEILLAHLGALDVPSSGASDDAGPAGAKAKITELGRILSHFPISPRFAKMIVVAAKQGEAILQHTIAIAAGLSVGDPFVRDAEIMGIVNDKRAARTSDVNEDDDGDNEEQQEKKEQSKK